MYLPRLYIIPKYFVLTCTFPLKFCRMFKIKRLEKAHLAEKPESLESEIQLVRLKLAETQDSLKVTTNRAANLEEELAAIRGETEGYNAKVRWRLVKLFVTEALLHFDFDFVVYPGIMKYDVNISGLGPKFCERYCNRVSSMHLSNWRYSS